MLILGKIIGLSIVPVLLIGCVSTPAYKPYRTHPLLEDKRQAIKTVVVLPPKVEVFQITAGGLKEKIDEWSVTATENVLSAIEGELKGRVGKLLKFSPPNALSPNVAANLEETQALFEAVNTSVILHTYSFDENRPSNNLFPEKIEQFDYSLGSEVNELAKHADALLMVRGEDQISTSGRKALQTTAFVISTLLGAPALPNEGLTIVSAALVDAKTGEILWYNFKAVKRHDLRDEISAGDVVGILLSGFPMP